MRENENVLIQILALMLRGYVWSNRFQVTDLPVINSQQLI
jgi:hypothetical protein